MITTALKEGIQKEHVVLSRDFSDLDCLQFIQTYVIFWRGCFEVLIDLYKKALSLSAELLASRGKNSLDEVHGGCWRIILLKSYVICW